jgi:ABC-type multidrug transport system ATPase subunit
VADAAGVNDATVRLTSEVVQRHGRANRAVAVEKLFGSKDRLVIGRAGDCDICLPHPTVSRRHALLVRGPAGFQLHDLDSVNGVFVGGQRINEAVLLKENELVGIGPFLFCVAGGILYTVDSSQSLRLEARNLEKTVPLKHGQVRKLLDDINLAVEPGEFVSLLGPSGSGKSTLMDCLNGRRPATGGQVLANGEDFYRHFDSFRQSLGYVPQKDIVHTQLTVYRALYYTARLRLPPDTTPSELMARIQEVLDKMELQPHRDTLVANLSGGQIKRVSLGAELLARPCLLYIDEATSGLDAGTEARMMRLFRLMADEGKSVVCITHNVDNVDECNLILMLARGKLVYYGPPSEARPYFQVSRLSEVYDRLAEKDPQAWHEAFKACTLYQEFVAKRLESAPAPRLTGSPAPVKAATPPAVDPHRTAKAPVPAAPVSPYGTIPPHPPFWHQFSILATRYTELIWGDPRSLRLLLLQAPIVALFVLLGFARRDYEHKVLVPRRLTEEERAFLRQHRPAIEKAEQAALEEIRPLYQEGDPRRAAELTARLVKHLRSQLPESKEADLAIALLGSLHHWLDAHVKNGEQAAPVTALVDAMLQSQGPVLPSRVIIDPRFTYMLLFLLVIIVLWFGCNNAAKEIVKEEAIYGRERAVNLGIVPYLASKFLVLCFISAIQVLLLMLIIYGVIEILHSTLGWDAPPLDYRLNYIAQYGVLVLLAMTGVALGLLLSACVSSPDRANTLLPYVLIPQIILGGGILPVKDGLLHAIAFVTSPAYWGFRAVRRGAVALPVDLPVHMNYNDSVWLACAGMGVQMMILLGLTAWFLKQKDVRQT